MRNALDRINGLLGRLIFRAAGVGCGLIAVACGYAAYWHVENRDQDYAVVGALLFALATVAALAVMRFCFSRNRTLVEALDAMEDPSPDLTPRGSR